MAKYSPEIVDKLCELISVGYTNKDAAQAVGIDESRFYIWMKKKASFASRVNQAIAKNKYLQVARIQTASEKDWKAALAYLERKYPEEWGKKDEIKLTGKLNFYSIFDDATDENETERLAAGQDQE